MGRAIVWNIDVYQIHNRAEIQSVQFVLIGPRLSAQCAVNTHRIIVQFKPTAGQMV